MAKKEETKHVDGFVFRVSKENVSAYKKIAKKSARIWMKHGALSYKECMIDEPDPEMHGDMKDMPFDVKKMAFGGFKVAVSG